MQANLTESEKTDLKTSLLVSAWEDGDLFFKLFDHQLPLYEAITKSKSKKYVINCSRRFGKSFVLCLIAIEHALRNRNSHVRFAAPTQKQLREIIQPIFTKLTDDAPEQFKPVSKVQESHYYFPSTGSYIHVAGCDNGNAENLRGHESDLNLVDEAGFIDDLEYVIKDILTPQTLTTGGRTIISSTPPRTPSHYFTRLCQEAKLNNSYSIYTIDDNTSISEDVKREYCLEAGGEDSTTWRREYKCEFVIDSNSVIIPEWKREYIYEVEPDAYRSLYQNYVSMDVGGRHKTAILFGYYHFRKSVLQIEDEAIFSGVDTTTDLIARTVKAREEYLWKGLHGLTRRIADNNNVIMLQDMSALHGVAFAPTSKDTLFAMVNELRIFIGQGRLAIAPKCKELIGCLETAIWNKNRTEFDISDLYGHYDALAALIYMVRNLDQFYNPIPPTGTATIDTHFIKTKNTNTERNETLRKLIGAKTNGRQL